MALAVCHDARWRCAYRAYGVKQADAVSCPVALRLPGLRDDAGRRCILPGGAALTGPTHYRN